MKLVKRNVKLRKVGDIALFLTGVFQGGDVLLLKGDLGAGKTTLVSELTKVFETTEKATSPTFAIVQEYSLPRAHRNIEKIIHIDAYRLRHVNELYDLGLETIFAPNSLTIIEWGDQIEPYIEQKYFVLTIDEQDKDSKRTYTLETIGIEDEDLLKQIKDSMQGFKVE